MVTQDELCHHTSSLLLLGNLRIPSPSGREAEMLVFYGVLIGVEVLVMGKRL